MPSRASIVIPAYNEETRIRALLDSLSDPSIRGNYDIYVVCNGCTDRTLQVAEEYPGVVAVEIDAAGKYLALNEGDRLAGDVYPRLYCDADVRISPSSITALAEALTVEEVRVAAPSVRYATEDSTWLVRMFYRAVESPVVTVWLNDHLIGRGLYGASRAARRRFDVFPALLADDLYFELQFDPSERMILPEAIATTWVPTNIHQLLRREVRAAEGNRQYLRAPHANDTADGPAEQRRGQFEPRQRSRMATLRRWRRDLRGRDIVPIFVYLGVRITARTILAVRMTGGRKIHWR
jgi:glycosyltransferase involved in cell wall biosynthesis